jgi:peroxiredoxin
MAQFEPFKARIEGIGRVAFVAAEKRGGMFKPESFLQKNTTPFPFLLDEDRAVTKTYGVYQRLRVDAINIARPATFIVDRQGMIRSIYVGSSQFDRWAMEELLTALQQAAS